MKLIIRQYLASLKERGELDALLPDLLSQMGLDVFLKPGIGARQYGVDVGAYGKLPNTDIDKVYLFSIKAGDLDRKSWDGRNAQDLRPSLNEIIDVFIGQNFPAKYNDSLVEICLCFGGDIKEEVRSNVSGFTKGKTTDRVSFSEWNGDKLAELIEQHMLRVELMPDSCRSLLRKSLAMIDEPDTSYQYFKKLTEKLSDTKTLKDDKVLRSMRQLSLCLWILYAWCREEENLESAYLASELVVLHSWEIAKPYFHKKNKASEDVVEVLNSTIKLYLDITSYFIDQKIVPHLDNMYALSHAVSSSCAIDVNLKLFDLLGRLALTGFWTVWQFDRFDKQGQREEAEACYSASIFYQEAMVKLLIHNPGLFIVRKDSQIIELSLALWFLTYGGNRNSDASVWLDRTVWHAYRSLKTHGAYPSLIDEYSELLTHPLEKTVEYRDKVTKGSVLYPYLSIFAALVGNVRAYERIKEIKNDILPMCTFQMYFFDESSEENFYKNDAVHGAVLADIPVSDEPEKLLDFIKKECAKSNALMDMSVIKAGLWPILLSGCRHYRLPVPIGLFLSSDEE